MIHGVPCCLRRSIKARQNRTGKGRTRQDKTGQKKMERKAKKKKF